jgi:hypothetical protein
MNAWTAYLVQYLAAWLLPTPPTPPEAPMESHAYIAVGNELHCPLCGRKLRLRPGALFDFDVIAVGTRAVNHTFGMSAHAPPAEPPDEPPPWLMPVLRSIEEA